MEKREKVGSLIGDDKDIERRKTLSTAALNRLNTIWLRNDKIKQSTRIHLYRSLVKSVLLYNSATWGVTKSDVQKLDSFHRKQLRKVLGIRYPTIITNKKLYEKCNEKPISITILEARWKLFGHILRRDMTFPANLAMTFYFTKEGRGFRGHPRTTLPVTLNKDLERLYSTLHTSPKGPLILQSPQAEKYERPGGATTCGRGQERMGTPGIKSREGS